MARNTVLFNSLPACRVFSMETPLIVWPSFYLSVSLSVCVSVCLSAPPPPSLSMCMQKKQGCGRVFPNVCVSVYILVNEILSASLRRNFLYKSKRSPLPDAITFRQLAFCHYNFSLFLFFFFLSPFFSFLFFSIPINPCFCFD